MMNYDSYRNFTKSSAKPDPAEVEVNRQRMANLQKRCMDGKVRAIVVPASVSLRGGSTPRMTKKKKRNPRYKHIPINTLKLWHSEYMNAGETLRSVAGRHGISPATLRVKFKEAKLVTKPHRGSAS